ncbi:hypothetical protein K432DRAFT_358407, partial [Lepidopterella palustris CBS 459.81]
AATTPSSQPPPPPPRRSSPSSNTRLPKESFPTAKPSRTLKNQAHFPACNIDHFSQPLFNHVLHACSAIRLRLPRRNQSLALRFGHPRAFPLRSVHSTYSAAVKLSV